MKNIYGEEKGMKKELEKLKNAPASERRAYIWEYYGRKVTFGIILLLLLAGLILFIAFEKKESVLTGTFYDFQFEDADVKVLEEKILLRLGETNKKKTDIIYTLLDQESGEGVIYQFEALAARIAASELDFIAGKKTLTDAFVADSKDDTYYKDLRTVLSDEEFKKLEEQGRIIYAEKSYGKIPYFVDISHSYITEILKIDGDDIRLGICITAPHVDSCRLLLQMLTE